jgi:hypothetical protein
MTPAKRSQAKAHKNSDYESRDEFASRNLRVGGLRLEDERADQAGSACANRQGTMADADKTRQ